MMGDNPAQGQELDSMVLTDPLQFNMFYGSMITMTHIL